MSWTVACFCGTVFHAPRDRCPTCHTPLPSVTTGDSGQQPGVIDAAQIAHLLRSPRRAR